MDELILHRYLDGRLDERQRQEVEDALRSDPAARRTLDVLREEARLIAAVLDTRVEPSYRIAEKVVAQLHLEERARASALRTRRMFRRLASAAAIAAALLLCVFLVRPRDPAGSMLSGTHATLLAQDEKRELRKGVRLYENDEIITEKGQFIRIGLAQGAILDVDEHSHFVLDKGGAAPVLRMSAGRAGLTVPAEAASVVVEMPQGSVEITAGSKVDLWLPEGISARWPGIFFAPGHFANGQPAANLSVEKTAIVSVFNGVARLSGPKGSEMVSALKGVRASMTSREITQRRINLAGSRVLDERNEDSVHSRDNVELHEWTRIGLMDAPEFEALGRRWGLSEKAPKQIAEALKQLDAALLETAHAARAEKIAAGQQALRQACEALPQNDPCRPFGSTLEGLAHFEEGRARFAARSDNAGAHASFEAARVVFESALAPVASGADGAAANASDNWRNAFANGATPDLRGLPPVMQSGIMASFRHALAQYWSLRTSAESNPDDGPILPGQPAESFAELHEELGHSVESLAALLGEAYCHELAGDDAARRKAIDALHVIVSKPLVATEGLAREEFAGIQQAALVALIRLHSADSDAPKTLDAAHDFELLYPLDKSGANAEMRTELQTGLEKQAAKALKEKHSETALEACEALLAALNEAENRPASNDDAHEIRHAAVHLDLLEALVGSKDWARALREADALNGQLTPEFLPRFNALKKQIDAAVKK